MMPPRAGWKIRPSGVVPSRLMCAEPPDQLGGDGTDLGGGAVLGPAFLTEGAIVGPSPGRTIRPGTGEITEWLLFPATA